MRLPGRSELSEEQERIFIEAPLNGSVLISGPPGTGKTVLAILRAVLLNKSKVDFSLVMQSKVLVAYTRLALEQCEIDDKVTTWHSWVSRWWRDGCRSSIPTKRRWVYDFGSALELLMTTKSDCVDGLNWGHLILDEGQDFPTGFYDVIGYISILGKSGAGAIPSLTVLADEHQRLETDRHSTLLEIAQRLAIGKDHRFQLTENFRNTYEIAALARTFFVGSPDELPRLPAARRGKVPELRRFDSLEEEARYIAKFLKNNDDLDVGIFIPRATDQMKLYELLSGPLSGSGMKLQMYASGSAEWKDAARLAFGSKGSVTLLTDKSCKGLEFDAVFVPMLNKYNIEGAEEEFVQMKFYVMCSRARSFLTLSYSDSVNRPEIFNLLPDETKGLLKWKI